jgi:toxin-antitoxin system PIN domain toxin
MILVDANILLYAEDKESDQHETARIWWDHQLSGTNPVGLCWPVLSAFLRISTNVRLYQRPLTPTQATDRVQSWLEQPCVRILSPGEEHWTLFRRLVREQKATGNLVSDAHLAALALEHNAVLFSTDLDFAKFRDLKWENPLR